jgi:hypothetical protein
MRAARILSGWSVPPDRIPERPPIEDNGAIRKVPWQRDMWIQASRGLPMAEIEIRNTTWSILKNDAFALTGCIWSLEWAILF